MIAAGRDAVAYAKKRGISNPTELARLGQEASERVGKVYFKISSGTDDAFNGIVGITKTEDGFRFKTQEGDVFDMLDEDIPVGTAATATKLIEPLKYFSPAPNGIEHIFKGVVNSSGTKSDGWHHEPSSSIGRILQIIDSPNTQGVYRAKVEIGGVEKTATSTFFPKKWSQDKVIEEIYSAYKNAKPSLKPDGTEFTNKWEGISDEGLRIIMFVDNNGCIVSAYPYMP